MKQKIKKIIKQRKAKKTGDLVVTEGVPRITNETVAEHREEVLKGARKYIYPLTPTKHRIVIVSTIIFITAIISFFTYCTLALYQFGSNSTFLYRVTQVIPFPIGRVGKRFVAYENYLFELRHYVHYYETQQRSNFADTDKAQLEDYKKRALDKVVNDAYVKELAQKYRVSVSNQEVEDQIAIVRNQNKLGSSDKVFEDVLKDFWGWTVDDFRRSLKQQLLTQKVISVLDSEAHQRAQSALAELKNGVDFAAVAKKYSDDPSRDNGGEFGYQLGRTDRSLSGPASDALFRLTPGQYSDVVNTGYSLEIFKNIEQAGDKIRGAHVVINFKDISTYLNDIKDQHKTRLYYKP